MVRAANGAQGLGNDYQDIWTIDNTIIKIIKFVKNIITKVIRYLLIKIKLSTFFKHDFEYSV